MRERRPGVQSGWLGVRWLDFASWRGCCSHNSFFPVVQVDSNSICPDGVTTAIQPQTSSHDLSGRRQNRRGYDRRKWWLLARRTQMPRWNWSEPLVEPPEQMSGPGIWGRGPSAARRNLNSLRQKRLNGKIGQEPQLTASAGAADSN